MDPDDRKLFAESLRQAIGQHSGADLDAALDELGWAEALTLDPRDAVTLLFELQGAANVTSSALQTVLTDALGVEPGVGIVLPPLGKWHCPAVRAGDRLLVQGLAVGALHGGLAVAWDGPQPMVAVAGADDLDLRSIAGIDPALGLVQVTGTVALHALAPVPADWAAAVSAGRVALAYEIVGACRTMLRLAREHALQRVQFGRPIAGFQAVRHRLADSLLSIEAAQACADASWDAAREDAGALPATLAKAVAGTTARTVGKHAQQVLGGMGYTTDHPLHQYVRRTLVLDQLLGAGSVLTREIGAELLRVRDVPELLDL
jgi:hypothetical protein